MDENDTISAVRRELSYLGKEICIVLLDLRLSSLHGIATRELRETDAVHAMLFVSRHGRLS